MLGSGDVILSKVDLTLSVFYSGFSMCPAWIDDQDVGYAFQFLIKVAIYRPLGVLPSG